MERADRRWDREVRGPGNRASLTIQLFHLIPGMGAETEHRVL